MCSFFGQTRLFIRVSGRFKGGRVVLRKDGRMSREFNWCGKDSVKS